MCLDLVTKPVWIVCLVFGLGESERYEFTVQPTCSKVHAGMFTLLVLTSNVSFGMNMWPVTKTGQLN